ncbi:hypothetical protein RFI_23110 [Reticulomyxa filosa]|uniref:Uncharacterized protein n=1 Tax=Reticulomyxa filosa TaxID=46433 RepID=X6MJR6_RETFI|nr:hypothetical protein RFI_23110 [Reticulomyxa filosa]|eukprot:ETO14258.1 hypothetical protein RFI_23110 [Reticulomyxa filosa]
MSPCIAFFNVILSSACLFWYLTVRQFVKTTNGLNDNWYNTYGSDVSDACYEDAFTLRLVDVFRTLAVIVSTLFFVSLALQFYYFVKWRITCENRLCNLVHSSIILGVFAVTTILLGFSSLISFFIGFVQLETLEHEPIHQFVLGPLVVIISTLGYFDIFLWRCCCKNKNIWFSDEVWDFFVAFAQAMKEWLYQQIICITNSRTQQKHSVLDFNNIGVIS